MKGQGRGDGRRESAVCTVSLETPTSSTKHQATIWKEETLLEDTEPFVPRATSASHKGCFLFAAAKFFDSVLALQ